MFKLPSYDQVMKDKEVENEFIYKGTVKLVIPDKDTYEIPRKNFAKVKESIFGNAFIIENKKEFEWSNKSPAVEDLVVKLITNKNTNFRINDFNGTVSEMISIFEELKEIGMDGYFKTTALGENWIELIKINKVCNKILINKESCVNASELWVRALNEALKLNIYVGDFEIANSGKIALNGKDISSKVLSGLTDYNSNKDLLISFCFYCDIYNFWDKIINGVQWMLFQNKDIYNNIKLLEKEPICYDKSRHCCYQSTLHRHFKFNLIPYVNYVLTGSGSEEK